MTSDQEQSVRRRVRAGLTLACATSVALAVASPASAQRNLVVNQRVSVTGCPGFSVFGTGGFVPESGLGACAVRASVGGPLERGAQGRIQFDAPSGTTIASIENWRFGADAHTGQIATELWWTTVSSGDVRHADYGNEDVEVTVPSLAPHDPSGARSVFLMARSHAYFGTPQLHFMWLHGDSRVHVWDYSPPTISEVSVDGGGAWSSSPVRLVRMGIDDNLGQQGMSLARVQAGSTILRDETAPAPGPKAYWVDLSSLRDGEHTIQTTVTPAGSGDLPSAQGAGQVVRLDRTPPSRPSTIDGIPSTWTAGDVSLTPSGASDLHSGVASHQWRLSSDGGASWSSPIQARHLAPTDEGTFLLEVRSVDAVGLVSDWLRAPRSLRIDRTGPEVTAQIPGGKLAGTVPVTAMASDSGSGVASIVLEYRTLGNGSWTRIGSGTTSPLGAQLDAAALTDGSYELRVRATDNAGNEATDVREFAVQGTAGGGPAAAVIVVPAQATAQRAAQTSGESAAVDEERTAGASPGDAGGRGGRAILDVARTRSLNRGRVRLLAPSTRFRVTFPRPGRLRIAGRLIDPSATPLAERTVVLEHDGARVAAGRSDAAGRFQLAYVPRSGGTLRALVDGRPVGAWAVRARPFVRAKASRSARAGRAWIVRGRVTPGPGAQGVSRHIALLYGVDTRRCTQLRHVVAAGHVFATPRPGAARRIPERCWRPVRTARVDRGGRFVLRFRDFSPLTLNGRPYPGGYRYAAYFQVRVPKTGGWNAEPGRSRLLRVTVRG